MNKHAKLLGAAVIGSILWIHLLADQPLAVGETTEGVLTGVITSIDTKARSLKLKLEFSTRTFQVAKDAKILKRAEDKGTVNDEEGTLADLKVGEVVVVNYTEEKGAAIAHRVAPKKPAIEEAR